MTIEAEIDRYTKSLDRQETDGLATCQSDCDGDCYHPDCPQTRDGEPEATGRSCPLYEWHTNNPEEERRH